MYVSKLKIENIRSISELELTFEPGHEAGWHVILGDNGSGKSTVIRSIALAMVGSDATIALRQSLGDWLRNDCEHGEIDLRLVSGDATDSNITTNIQLKRTPGTRLISHGQSGGGEQIEKSKKERGWFAASFGSQRRFGGGDRDIEKLFYTYPEIAPHLTAFGEDISLNEGLRWLQSLQVEMLESPGLGGNDVLPEVVSFINSTNLLPNGEKIGAVTSKEIFVHDADNKVVSIGDLSDGFRSILSLAIELFRQIYMVVGRYKFLELLDNGKGTMDIPGVVAIDEVDAHLHPSWQKEIGEWFTKRFPKIQFIVTTHSPIVCRAAAESGSIWRLPAPGSGEKAYRVQGPDLNRLLYGNILDAFSTDLFGEDVTRSELALQRLQKLARLNMKSARGKTSKLEETELAQLREMFPSSAPILKTESKDGNVEAAE